MSESAPRTERKRRAGQPRKAPNLVLLEARIRAGLSRQDVGALAGVTSKQVGAIERGEVHNPRPATKTNIARAVKSDVIELFPLKAPRR